LTAADGEATIREVPVYLCLEPGLDRFHDGGTHP
jgi:hypothetical protein